VFEDLFMSQLLLHLKTLAGRKDAIGDKLSSPFSDKVIKVCKEEDILFLYQGIAPISCNPLM